MLRIGRAGGSVRLRWQVSDNASAHLRISISTAGHGVTLPSVPLAGRRTLALAAAGADLTAAITITDESGNVVLADAPRRVGEASDAWAWFALCIPELSTEIAQGR